MLDSRSGLKFQNNNKNTDKCNKYSKASTARGS